MKIAAPLVMSVFAMLGASGCAAEEQAAQAAPPPPVMNAQGEMGARSQTARSSCRHV